MTEYLYDSIRSLWIQYCGTCNEFLILTQKWRALECPPFLPVIKPVFNNVKKLILDTDRIFERSGFKKHKPDYKQRFIPPIDVFDLEQRFLALSQYLGILKVIFGQRTVSLEIPYIVTNLARSPEINIGNEAQYLAADILARSYVNSLYQIKTFFWDGLISFTYPMEQEFFGGAFSQRPHLSFYHLGISEEAKTFLGRYSLLAHEAAHSCMISIESREMRPAWLLDLIQKIRYEFEQYKEKIFNDSIICGRDCHTNYVINELSEKNELFAQLVEECIADVVAFKIGGVCTLRSLVDFFLNKPEIVIRIAFLTAYLIITNSNHLEKIGIELKKIEDMFMMYGDRKNKLAECKRLEECYRNLYFFGMFLGKSFVQNSKNINKIKAEINVDEDKNSILDYLINNEFSYDHVNDIEDKLKTREIFYEKDPRVIIEAFYNNYRNNEGADYLCVLFSMISSYHQQ